MHGARQSATTLLEPLRLAAVLAHVLPLTDVAVTTPQGRVRIGPLSRGGHLPLGLLRQAVAEALTQDDLVPVTELLGAPVAELAPEVQLGHAAAGARSLGGGIYEVRWAGRTTCLFATVLREPEARVAVRAASTFPSDLDGVPISALGLDPSPHRIAVVPDAPTGTTVFGLDRATGADPGVIDVVRTAMTAAAAVCLVAELTPGLQPHHLPPDR